MKTLRELNDRINQLQQIIDTEQQDADAGCDWSRSVIINAEIEQGGSLSRWEEAFTDEFSLEPDFFEELVF